MNLRHLIIITLFLAVGTACQRIEPDWKEVESHSPNAIRSICFVDSLRGYVVGGAQFSNYILLHTADGGKTWENTDTNLFNRAIYDLDFEPSGQRGFGCGVDGKMIYTDDKAETWTPIFLPFWRDLQSVDFVHDSLCVAVGGMGYARGFIQIHKGGGFWEWAKVDSFPFSIQEVKFSTPTMGFACGYGTILKTADAGNTWQHTPAQRDYFKAIDFPSAKIGYAVGRAGTILKTTDAGESWEILRNGNSITLPKIRWNDVCFLSENVGYLVGDKGIIWKTTNGGKDWQKFERFNKARLYCIEMLKEGHGFIGDTDGKLYEFTE